ncbi:MAG TPA: glycoside hydrolase family protein [Brevundimonas sp.]
MQRLKISREGVILIKSFEGFRPRAIRRDNGQWVIGYGHTASAREGASVSETDAELLLQYDLIPIVKALNEGVAARLNQHQFDALASFAYSVGLDRFQGSDVLARLNAGFAGEAADALVGWPEPVLPETSLRRRAAERALFVADPASPVALSDLLVAPIPALTVAEKSGTEADATLAEVMGDPAPQAVAPLSETNPVLRQAEALRAPPSPATDHDEPALAPAAFTSSAVVFNYPGAQAMQRYSAYPGSIVGPLPAPLHATRAVSEVQPIQSTEADVESVSSASDTTAAISAPEPAQPVETDVEAAATPEAPVVPATDLSAPWGTPPVPRPFPALAPESEVLFPDFSAVPTAAPTGSPNPWPSISAVSEPRTDGELIVTSTEGGAVFASPRLVWPHEDQTSGEALPMFEDDGSLRLAPGNIIRHEPLQQTAPTSIPWGELGAYGLMGAFGLVSFGMSMAAFRRASQDNPGGDGTTLIAIVLAVIGATCVGVSAYNLYRRWGRTDDE